MAITMTTAAIAAGVASIALDMAHSATKSTTPTPKRKRAEDYYPGPIFGALPTIKPIQKVGAIVSPATLQPIAAPTQVAAVTPISKLYYNGFNNPTYNILTDPFQVNSTSDVLFNQEGRDIVMEDLNLSWVDNIPVLGSIAETVIVGADMINQKTIQPLVNKKYADMFVNSLYALGEDLDFVSGSNAVKGMILEPNNPLKGLQQSFGIGAGGKTTYEYNTGNFAADLTLEIITDPGTWLSLGAAVLPKQSVSVLNKAMVRTARELGMELNEQTAKQISKRISNAAIKKYVETGTKVAADEAVQSVIKEFGELGGEFMQRLYKEYSTVMDDIISSDVMSATRKIAGVNKLFDEVSANVLKTSVLSAPYHLYKSPVVNNILKHTQESLSRGTDRALRNISEVLSKDPNGFEGITTEFGLSKFENLNNEQVKAVEKPLKILENIPDLGGINGDYLINRGSGIMNAYGVIEPEQFYNELINTIKSDVKNKGYKINTNIFNDNEAIKEYITSTIYHGAVDRFKVYEAVNKNFVNMRASVIDAMDKSETNLEALIRLSDYFDTKTGKYKSLFKELTDLKSYLDNLNERFKVADSLSGSAMFVTRQKELVQEQIEFYESIFKQLDIDIDIANGDLKALAGYMSMLDEYSESGLKDIKTFIDLKSKMNDADYIELMRKEKFMARDIKFIQPYINNNSDSFFRNGVINDIDYISKRASNLMKSVKKSMYRISSANASKVTFKFIKSIKEELIPMNKLSLDLYDVYKIITEPDIDIDYLSIISDNIDDEDLYSAIERIVNASYKAKSVYNITLRKEISEIEDMIKTVNRYTALLKNVSDSFDANLSRIVDIIREYGYEFNELDHIMDTSYKILNEVRSDMKLLEANNKGFNIINANKDLFKKYKKVNINKANFDEVLKVINRYKEEVEKIDYLKRNVFKNITENEEFKKLITPELLENYNKLIEDLSKLVDDVQDAIDKGLISDAENLTNQIDFDFDIKVDGSNIIKVSEQLKDTQELLEKYINNINREIELSSSKFLPNEDIKTFMPLFKEVKQETKLGLTRESHLGITDVGELRRGRYREELVYYKSRKDPTLIGKVKKKKVRYKPSPGEVVYAKTLKDMINLPKVDYIEIAQDIAKQTKEEIEIEFNPLRVLKENYQTLYDKIDEAVINVNNIYIKMDKTGKIVRLMQSIGYNRTQLISKLNELKFRDRSILSHFIDISNNEPTNIIASVINSMAAQRLPLAEQVVNSTKSLRNYINLVTNLKSIIKDTKLKDTPLNILLDRLESDARLFIDDDLMLKWNKEHIKDIILDNTDLDRLEGVSKNSKFYKKYVIGSEQEDAFVTNAINTSQAHDALVDIEITARNYMYLKDKYNIEVPDGTILTFMDLETTGLSTTAAKFGDEQVLQVAAQKYIVKDKKLIKFGEPLNLYAKPNRALSFNTKSILPSNTLKEITNSINTEEDILNSLNAFMEGTTVVGHNIKEFDLKYLEAKGIIPDKISVEDTLDIMKEKIFKNRLTQDDGLINYIDNFSKLAAATIQDYMSEQVKTGKKFIETMDAESVNDIYSLLTQSDVYIKNLKDGSLVQQAMATELDDFRASMLGRGSVFDSSVNVKTVAQMNDEEMTMLTQTSTENPEGLLNSYRETLTKIKNFNRDLKQYYLDLSNADEIPGLGGKSLYNYLNSGIVDETMYNNFKPSTLSYKKIYDSGHINILNKSISEDGIINAGVKDLARLEVIKRKLDNIYNKLHLSGNFIEADKTLLKNNLLQDFGNEPLLNLIDLDTASFAEIYTLYTYMSFNTVNRATGRLVEASDAYKAIKDMIENNSAIKLGNREYLIYNAEIQRNLDIVNDFLSHSPEEIDKARAYLLTYGDDIDAMNIMAAAEREFYMPFGLESKKDIDNYNKIMSHQLSRGSEFFKVIDKLRESVSKLTRPEKEILNNINKQIAINETKTILTMDSDYLLKYMYKHQPIIVLVAEDFDMFATDLDVLIKNKEKLNELGINIFKDNDRFVLSLAGDKIDSISKYVDNIKGFKVNYKATLNTDGFSDNLKDTIQKYIETYGYSSRLSDLDLPFDEFNHAVNTMSSEDYHKNIIDKLPIDVANTLPDEQFFGRVLANNHNLTVGVIGTVDGRRVINKYISNSPVNSQTRYMHNLLTQSNAKNKYLTFFSNNEMRAEVWNNFTDDQALEFFQGNEAMSAIYFVEDPKFGVTVKSIKPKNIEEVKMLREYAAIPLDQSTANAVLGSINGNVHRLKANHPYLYKWREYVISGYKSIFLSSPGFPVRNFIDGPIVKNTNQSGLGAYGLVESVKYSFQAFRMWDLYSKQISEILFEYEHLTRDSINKYFKAHPEYDTRLFSFVHDYATSAMSAGLASAQEKAVRAFNLEKHGITNDMFKAAMFENAYTKNIMNINTNVEHIGRLGLLLQRLDAGDSTTQAMYEVIRTHFDYTNVSYNELLAETIIPFVTFPIRNLEFWAKNFEKNPWLIKMITDTVMLSNDVRNNTQFMLDNSDRLDNNINNGNVRFGDVVLKANPSLFDASQLITNPTEELDKRLAPPFKAIINGVRDIAGLERTSYSNENVTKLEQTANDWGLYSLTRAAHYAMNAPTNLVKGKISELLPGSLFSTQEVSPKHLIKNYTPVRRAANTSNYGIRSTYSSKTGGSSIKTSGRAYARIPYVKRYYNPILNYYNFGKLKRLNKNSYTAATPEALMLKQQRKAQVRSAYNPFIRRSYK